MNSLWLRIIIFSASLLPTALIRIDWTHAWRMMTVDEKRPQEEIDHSLRRNKASLADRGENYSRAAELYKQVLRADSGNLQCRFNRARTCLHRLDDRSKAELHLRTLPAQHHRSIRSACSPMRNS